MALNMRIDNHLLDIATPYKGILLDAYGVFWGGGATGVIPGSHETMASLIKLGKVVGILSNTTQPVEKEMRKLEKHGLIQGEHYHFLVTSGEVARQVFQSEKLPFETGNKKYWVFGGTHPKYGAPHEVIFQGSTFSQTQNLAEASFIYISIPHIQGEDQVDPQVFEKEVDDLIPSKLPMICANPDRFAHEGNPPRPVVRQGSIASLYENRGGKVIYIGKPHKNVFEEAMKKFSSMKDLCPNELLMVGDTPETDIRGAKAFGMVSALVTETGIAYERVKEEGLERFLSSLKVNEIPDYFIKSIM